MLIEKQRDADHSVMLYTDIQQNINKEASITTNQELQRLAIHNHILLYFPDVSWTMILKRVSKQKKKIHVYA